MWISRLHEKTLHRLFGQFPVLVLTGTRQAGKTSLVRKIFPGLAYRSLDLPEIADAAERTPADFLKGLGLPAIIDEVQYAPGVFRYVKAEIDLRGSPGQLVLTGSQVFPLMQGVSESLAGRSAVLDLHTLSAAELAAWRPDEFDPIRFLFMGGFPALHAGEELDTEAWFSGYLATYLERDVRNLLNVGSLRDFNRFLRAAAVRTGQILSYSGMARDVGISPNTARKWLSVLQASGQVLLLEPYFKNVGKRLVKSPKLHFCDSGLAAFLMGFTRTEELARHQLAGQFWESLCVMEVVKVLSAHTRRLPLWFWRTSNGDEVDLVVERDGKFLLVECKFTQRPSEADLKGIRRFMADYGRDSVAAAFVACRTAEPYPLADGVTAVPVHALGRLVGN